MEQNQLTLGTYEESKGNAVDTVKKVEPVISKPVKAKEQVKVQEEDNWPEINAFVEKCKANKDNYAYFVVEYYNRSDIEITREGLSFDETVERLFRAEDDSYGGMWGSGGTDNADDFKEAALHFMRNFTLHPYKKNIQDTVVLTDIHVDNVKIFVSEKAKEYLANNGVDAEAVFKEVDLIISREADSDDWLLEQKFNEIEVEIEKLNGYISSSKSKGSNVGLIKALDIAVRSKAGIKEDYGRDIPLCPLEYSDKTIEELVKLKLEAQKKLQDLKSDEECFYKVHRGEITYEELKKMMLSKMIEKPIVENQVSKKIDNQSKKPVFRQGVKTMENNKPIEVLKSENGLSANIWDNNGRKSVQLSKSYMDKNKAWQKQSITFFDQKGLDNAINLLTQAKAKLQ